MRGEICPLIIPKRRNSAVLASMIGWWSNWVSAIAALKHLLIDTAATALLPGEAVADPESALLAHKDQDNSINIFDLARQLI